MNPVEDQSSRNILALLLLMAMTQFSGGYDWAEAMQTDDKDDKEPSPFSLVHQPGQRLILRNKSESCWYFKCVFGNAPPQCQVCI
jgi:hypothetical protein